MCSGGGGAAKVRRLSAMYICISLPENVPLPQFFVATMVSTGIRESHLQSIGPGSALHEGGLTAGPEKTLSLPLYISSFPSPPVQHHLARVYSKAYL